MKRIITILLLLTLLTGCSANYDINFDKETIQDTIEIYEDSDKVNKASDKDVEKVNDLLLDWENGYDYYKKELYSTDVDTGYRYTYEFKYEEYDAMSQIRKCYDNFNLETNVLT